MLIRFRALSIYTSKNNIWIRHVQYEQVSQESEKFIVKI